MKSSNNVRERCEALEQPMTLVGAHARTGARWLRGWHSSWSATLLVILGLVLMIPLTVQAKTFLCRAGDVQCLIAAIEEANASGNAEHRIDLEAGTYTLVEINNMTDGANGLPSIIGNVAVTGAGVNMTILERNVNTFSLRLGHVAPTGTLTLKGLTIQGFGQTPVGSCGPGGALYNRGKLTFSNTGIFNSYSRCDGPSYSGGGGVYNVGVLALSNTTIADNAAHYFGGGIANAGGTVRISQSTIARNASGGAGGGIYNTEGGTLTLMNTAVIDNIALGDGGLSIANGRVTIMNTTVAGNYGNFGVGGLSNGGTLTITNSTIAGNSGGIFSSGTSVLINTIISQNNISSDGIDCGGTITSQGYNLLGNLTGCTVTLQATDRTGDPGLGPFTDDETPGNGHFPLLSASRAINAGNPAACPRTDQLGQNRVGVCDIGAVEFQGLTVSGR